MLSDEKRCYVCGCTHNLEVHHIFHGTSNRKNSTKYGMVVYLCAGCHRTSRDSVHNNPNGEIDLLLKHAGEQKWLDEGRSKEEFIQVFGKWW